MRFRCGAIPELTLRLVLATTLIAVAVKLSFDLHSSALSNFAFASAAKSHALPIAAVELLNLVKPQGYKRIDETHRLCCAMGRTQSSNQPPIASPAEAVRYSGGIAKSLLEIGGTAMPARAVFAQKISSAPQG